MPHFGPHHDLVSAVIHFAYAGELLGATEPPPALRPFIHVVPRAALDQLDRRPDGSRSDLPSGLGTYGWYREKRSSEAYTAVSAAGPDVENAIWSAWPPGDVAAIGQRLAPGYYDLSDWINSDLLFIAYWRAGHGQQPNSFWELAFQIYLAGGMPVGYSGDMYSPHVTLQACFPALPPTSIRTTLRPTFAEHCHNLTNR